MRDDAVQMIIALNTILRQKYKIFAANLRRIIDFFAAFLQGIMDFFTTFFKTEKSLKAFSMFLKGHIRQFLINDRLF